MESDEVWTEGDDLAEDETIVTVLGGQREYRAGRWIPRSEVTHGRPPRRPWRVVDTLVERSAVISSLDELRAACADRLATELRALAAWDPDGYGETWVASDSAYLILAFATPEGGSAYVQFLSDPVHRTVLQEVSSADYQPGVARLIGPEKEAALLARGFSKGAPPSNYTLEVPIRDREAAEGVAAESLRIVFETLEYRGGQALVLEVVWE